MRVVGRISAGIGVVATIETTRLVISLAPQQGDDFRVMITPGNLDEVSPTFTIKDFAAGDLVKLSSNAVEDNPELQEFDCISGKGYYYMLTDKNHNPNNPEDFPLLMQVYSPAGELILMTTVLCQDKDSPVIKEVLRALSGAEGHDARGAE
jgi:hypothetical protein